MNTIPVRGAVLCSGSASSFRFVHTHDSNYGHLYDIVGVFSDVPGVKGIEYARELGIPTRVMDFKAWRKEKGIARTDLEGRVAYFEEVARQLAEWEAEFLMLSGFMLRVTEPLLSRFESRILNVHPALLGIMDGDVRKYTGLHVVERAMQAGDPTGSTVHLVTDEPDTGPIVCESVSLPYKQGDDPDAHQERMKTACDGPAFQAALEKLIVSGWPTQSWRPE